MKSLTSLALGLFSTAVVGIPTKARDSGFACAEGTAFSVDGSNAYLAGTNAYWMGFLTNNADIDTSMSELQQAGLKVLRVWGFNIATSTPSSGTVWYQSLIPGSSPAINTGADGLERLDYVVQSAESHGIKLVINFNNNWDAYGGMPAYMTYYNLATAQDWYQSSEAQATYQSYIQAVVSRYSSSSAIFAWELMNEPRCHGCDTSVVTNWASTTSAYIKSLDGSHMVTLGDEGFAPGYGDNTYPFTTEEGIDFAANLQISTLDYGTAHMYPSSWGVNDTTWASEWIQAHGDACVAANKPCVMEEYGYPSDQVAVEGPWQQKMLATKGIAMDQFWQFGTTLSGGLTPNDTFTIYTGTNQWTNLVTDHVAALGSSVN